MKQLTCEMCGSTDIVKQEGVFVCQACGCKYSVEEAKKLMVEIVGSVTVKNAPKLESLLKLAHSSFDSENYAKCEEFCNQIIAMNGQNFEAWKLKGDAIIEQINSKNRRELEACDCLLTAYRLLDDEKEEDKNNLLFSLEYCLMVAAGIDLRTTVFTHGFHVDETIIINKAMIIYKGACKSFKNYITTLGLTEIASEYLNLLKNDFIDLVDRVMYAQYTLIINRLKPIEERKEELGVDKGIKESDKKEEKRDLDNIRNLVKIMQFIEKQFFDNLTPTELKCEVYKTIIQFQSALKYRYALHYNEDTLDQYKQKYVDLICEEINKEAKVDLITVIISKYKNSILKKEYVKAEAYANVIMDRAPNSPIGYLGKALAIYGDDYYAIERDDTVILEYLRDAIHFQVSDEEQNDIKYIINSQVGDYEKTLLMFAASYYDFDLVKYMVDAGANINSISRENVNALWYVCRKKIAPSDLDAGKKIARLLLDSGSNIDVKSTRGVDLYNRNTNPEIELMIQEKSPEAKKGSSTGCYIATAVYGSYDCPPVWTLRRYRDYTLAKTWYGRAFIKTYYAISPTLVKWFGHTNWFKKMWQGKLDRMVAKLQANGVESTPYEDKNW